MTTMEGGPITVPLPQGSFEAVEGFVAGMNIGLRAANKFEPGRLSVKNDIALQQAAAAGILCTLSRMNVSGATALAAELEIAAGKDPYDDMGAVELHARNNLDHLYFELEEHEQALAETTAEQAHEDAIRQLEEQITGQYRYTRLAGAVAAVARATVAAVTGGNTAVIQTNLTSGRETVAAATEEVEVNGVTRQGTALGSAAKDALESMLDKLENPPLELLS